jgi:signal peptidase I
MAPALLDGDRVLAVRTPVARVRRRAVVVGRPPVGDRPRLVRDPATGALQEPVAVDLFVKRVVGLPGDRIRPRQPPGPPVDVPPGHYWVEGDGEAGVDSALWGPVPADHVLGVVVSAPRRPVPAAP